MSYDEIPHGIAVTIDKMDFEKPVVRVDATIICEKEFPQGDDNRQAGADVKKDRVCRKV